MENLVSPLSGWLKKLTKVNEGPIYICLNRLLVFASENGAYDNVMPKLEYMFSFPF